MSWFDTGYQGIKKEEDRLAQQYGPDRFWVKAGEKKLFVFVDDEPFGIHEHNPRINGDFKNWTTCLQGVYEDVACCALFGAQSRYYVGYYTVIDLSEWQDKKGNKHQYEIKYLPAKLKTLKKFQRKKGERGSLVGAIYSSVREDAKSPNVGDEFEFQREADMGKLFAVVNYKGKKLTERFTEAESNSEKLERLRREFEITVDAEGKIVPKIPHFNYMELLKPRTAKELRETFTGVKIEQGWGDGGGAAPAAGGAKADEEVPF